MPLEGVSEPVSEQMSGLLYVCMLVYCPGDQLGARRQSFVMQIQLVRILPLEENQLLVKPPLSECVCYSLAGAGVSCRNGPHRSSSLAAVSWSLRWFWQPAGSCTMWLTDTQVCTVPDSALMLSHLCTVQMVCFCAELSCSLC